MKKSTVKAAALLLAGTAALTGCAAGTAGTRQNSPAQGQAGEQETASAAPENRSLETTDPELQAIMDAFIGGQVSADSEQLNDTQKQLIALVSLVAQQSEELLAKQTREALEQGLEAVQIREAVYQCAPYVGFPRAVDALGIVNGVFEENGIRLPLEDAGTTEESTRFDLGLDAQAAIFGEAMREAASGGREAMARSAYYLVTNCFGDYYTREGLDLETREMLTLAILVNLGTESQITSHIGGNANLGRDRGFIEDVIYQCLPYAGYPRILNALNCLNAAIPEAEAQASGEDAWDSVFDRGDTNPFAEHFTGNTYLATLVPNEEVFNCPYMGNVTFEPCARTDWHSHDGGQILLVTDGRGYHQIEGQPAEILEPGDVVMVEPGVKHWHGAAADSWFAHIAITTNPENSATNWMEPVTDEEYDGVE